MLNRRRPSARGRRMGAVGAADSLGWAVIVVASAVMGCGARPPGPTDSQRLRASSAPVVGSNVLRKDYVGSAACQPCHAEVVAAWRASPMHRMNRLPDATNVRAPFDGTEFRFKDDTARFEQTKGTRFMRVRSAERGEHVYRVTKVIGGRYREDFAGVEVASADPGAAVVGDPRAELILPASFVYQTASFRLKGYSVMVGERPGLRAGGVWNQTCIFCHNTIPYFDDLWGVLHGPGAPGYQGSVVDRALPVARRMRYAVTDPAALIGALDHEVAVLGAAKTVASDGGGPEATGSEVSRAALRRAMLESRSRFGQEHFIEIGIGCEACHGGSREHVDDPRRHPTFEPRASFLTVTPEAGYGAAVTNVEWQNRACARCHQVLFSRYARTWEGGLRRSPAEAGGSHITSGEARDFLLGGCARALACTTCHDPHGEDRRELLARLATPAGNGVCTGCHQKFAASAALRTHAHHDPTGPGGSCVACHMPKKNMGLGYQLTRYHRIGSPTDAGRVERDRPIECALCHVDKTVGALLGDIARMWGKTYDPVALARLYGTLDANALVATIERGYAHEQAAAIGAAGERRFAPAARAIARETNRNPYPLLRYYAGTALAAIEGKPIPADLHGAPSDPAAPHRSPFTGHGDGDDED